MIDKRVLLIQKLKEKTLSGQTKWESTAEEGEFQAAFPTYSVKVSLRHEFGGADYHVLGVYNSDGVLVEEMRARDLKDVAPEEVNVFKEMEQLYGAARRQAMGVEAALQSILDVLDPKKNLLD